MYLGVPTTLEEAADSARRDGCERKSLMCCAKEGARSGSFWPLWWFLLVICISQGQPGYTYQSPVVLPADGDYMVVRQGDILPGTDA